MKIHLPLFLHRILLASLFLPVHASLEWNSGNWNTSDSSWVENGNPAVFTNGDSVVFSNLAVGKSVTITETVEPAAMEVSGSGYIFTGSGSISGAGRLTLAGGGSLSVQNGNTFSGGTEVAAGASLTLQAYNGVGTVNAGEYAMGMVSGAGAVIIHLADAGNPVSIQGDSWQDFTGVLTVQRGTLGLGRSPSHPGPGAAAALGSSRINVGAQGSFITSPGGGIRGLVTNNILSNEVRTESGATIGNRDGHINWSGNLYLNMQDVMADIPVYNAAGSTVFSIYYGKDVVWDGVVSGAGTVNLTPGVFDTGTDHRLILTNSANAFNGTYRVSGDFLTTLAVATETSAAAASVQLDSANARFILMNTDAQIRELNGTAGLVAAEGSGNYVLSLTGGSYTGAVQDAVSASSGLSLGITKTGSGNLELSGPGVKCSGVMTVLQGQVLLSGDASLASVSVASGAALSVGADLTLRSGAGLSVDISAASAAPVQAGGALALSDAVHLVHVSGYENLGAGQYNLLSWGSSSGVTAAQFAADGLNDTDEYVYSLAVQGNSLQLVVGNMADVPWLWSGGSATWTDDSAAEWSNADGSSPAGQELTFSSRNTGTVTIDRVTPAGVSIIGGQYTFVPHQTGSEGMVTAGNLTVRGDATVLDLQLNNPSFSGNTILQGGVLVVGKEQALGSSALYFNGGTLRYGDGISADLSGQLHAGSLSAVKLDINGNDVIWSQAAGVAQTLTSGLVLTGGAALQLNWQAAGDTHSGHLEVQDATLIINKSGTAGGMYGGFSGSGTLQLTSPAGVLTVGGNSADFSGTLILAGDGQSNTGSISFVSGESMGGAGTLVKVAGQRFWFASSTTTAASLEFAEENVTYFDGSTGNSYSFTGTISGSGNMLVVPSCNITMSGDISRYTGRLEHPGRTSVSWLFGGDGVDGPGMVQADLFSPGTRAAFVFHYAQPVTMSGDISGSANLRQSGGGVLRLTGTNTTNGNLTIDSGCEVQLGTASDSGSWGGAVQLGEGTFTLVNGSLTTPLTTMEGSLAADVAAGARVDMGGMDANVLQSITVAAGGQLAGMAGDVIIGSTAGVASLELTPAASNLGASRIPEQGQEVMLEIENGSLQIYDSASVILDMETVKSILQGQRQAVYIHISNAELQLQNGVTADSLFANSATTPAALGLTVLGVDGGCIVLEGAVRDVYMVMENGDYDTVTTYERLQPYKATFVDAGYTLSLNLPGDNAQQAWVNNLLGSGDFSVTNTAQAQGTVRVLLNNVVPGQVDSSLAPEQEAQIESANTEFRGDISCGPAVQLVKTGTGRLTVGGSLVTDWLEIDEGMLQLNGTGSSVGALYGDAGLILNGQLEITGDALGFTGNLSGTGALELNGTMNGAGTVGSLSGSGTLQAGGATFVIQNTADSLFTGSLQAGQGDGTLRVQNGGGRFTLQRIRSDKSWSVVSSGRMRLDHSGASDNTVLTLRSLELSSGSDTIVVFNSDVNSQLWELDKLVVDDTATLTLESTGSLPLELQADGTRILGSVETADLGADGRVPLTLGSGTVFRGISAAWLSVQDGQLIFHTRRDARNRYAEIARSANAATGAGLLWQIPNEVLAESPDLTSLTHALDALVEQGNAGAADKLLAAAAGAGAAVLGMAVVEDMERQLKSIRNRTTCMGLDPQVVYEDLPLFNFWVNAEGDRRELKPSGTATGYSLSSWGATLGMDWDFSPTLTAGLAFSGMYGDMQGKGPDDADGKVDTYYLSLFGRYAARRWTHTWVGVLGRSDISLKRHVHDGSGSYRTRGNTDALSLGLLYELGYVIPLDEDGCACLQPVMNLSYRYAGIDSYAEHGSDAALHIGKQRMNVVSFGLGARVQTYALENAVNRSSLLEARILLKVDAGDRRSDCDVALRAISSRRGRVRSAAAGRLGLEMGAGIVVPIGVEAGHLFLDAGFEFRSDETDVNGVVGYRLNF